MPPSEISSAAMSLITMSSAPTSSVAAPSPATPRPAPRTKEPRRRDLECKLLADTIKVSGSHMSNSAKRRLRKLLKHQGPKQRTEDALRKNDIDRRRGITELMRIRVAAGIEDHRVSSEWTAIAAVKSEKYVEMEQEHRGWILQELEARVGEDPATWILRRDQRNRKAEARLLRDTRGMPGRGGIPRISDLWLNHCLKKHPENLKTEVEMKAYYQARIYALNYIAACRRAVGIKDKLETASWHKGHKFSQIDEKLGTKQELETLARAELEKIHWEALSGDESDADTEVEEDEGGVAVEAGESSQRMPPEPISADEAESEDEDERMLPEPVSGGEEDERMLPEPVSGGEEEDDEEEADRSIS